MTPAPIACTFRAEADDWLDVAHPFDRCPRAAVATRSLAGVDVACCAMHEQRGGFIAAEYRPTFAALVAAAVEADQLAALLARVAP